MRQKKVSNMKQNVKYVENLTLRYALTPSRVSLYFGDFHHSAFHFSHWETPQISFTFFSLLQFLFFPHVQ